MNNLITHLYTYLNKIIILISSVLLITFSGCESDDPPQELKVENSIITLDFQDSIGTGVTSDYDIEYLVSDPYIATIENNYIKGNHVGKTSVIVTSNNYSELMSVNINSVFQLFKKPIQSYSNGKDHYHRRYDDLYYEDDSTLVFLQLNYDEEIAYYLQLILHHKTQQNRLFSFLTKVLHS